MNDSKGMQSTNYNSIHHGGDVANQYDYSPIPKSNRYPHLLTDTTLLPNPIPQAPSNRRVPAGNSYMGNT
jgi:hypothetical protein